MSTMQIWTILHKDLDKEVLQWVKEQDQIKVIPAFSLNEWWTNIGWDNIGASQLCVFIREVAFEVVCNHRLGSNDKMPFIIKRNIVLFPW